MAIGWRKPEMPAYADYDEKEEDWNAKHFFWLPVTTVFGKIVGLEEAFSKLISSISKEGLTFAPNTRMLLETSSFSSKVMVDIEPPDNYNAQVIRTDAGKVFSYEVIGDGNNIKKAIERHKEKIEKEGYVIQGIYQWFLSEPPWALTKTSRSVIFIRT